ncbi:hypothetical protein [Dactylosporangium maewongense]
MSTAVDIRRRGSPAFATAAAAPQIKAPAKKSVVEADDMYYG